MLEIGGQTSITTDVVVATRKDLDFICAWLKVEYDEDGKSGFWCNRNVIKKALYEPNTLWVIRRNGQAVAFQVGKYAADILSVRKDHRKSGMAKSLLEASIKRANADNVNVLAVECAPEASLGFWKRMGFEAYRNPKKSYALTTLRILPRAFSLPSNLSTVEVVIRFYPEAAIYGHHQNVPPIVEHRVAGVCRPDHSIMLERRVVGLCDDEPDDRDLTIKIEVGGVEHYFGKAKRQAAQHVGVKCDWIGKNFYIDRLNAKA